MSSDAVLTEIDRLGQRFQRRGALRIGNARYPPLCA